MKESVLPARNYHAHIWEGGLYLGGMAFVSAETVLPRIVEQLGATPLIISMMPTLLILGFMSPGVLVVPLLERLPRYYPFVMLAGFLQRLPYLLAGLALWFLGDGYPNGA